MNWKKHKKEIEKKHDNLQKWQNERNKSEDTTKNCKYSNKHNS